MNLNDTLDNPMSPADASEQGNICFKYVNKSILKIDKKDMNFEFRLPDRLTLLLSWLFIFIVGLNFGFIHNTSPLRIIKQNWWKEVTNIGNLKSSPFPNIHLLYMEMDNEKMYHPRI